MTIIIYQSLSVKGIKNHKYELDDFSFFGHQGSPLFINATNMIQTMTLAMNH